MTNFVSLHNQTNYSILDSTSNVKKLFEAARDLGQKAIAITEHGSLASTWEAWKVSKEVGIKLIIGCEMYFANDAQNREGQKLRHIILLAKNAIGYKNLLTLNKKGFDNNEFDGKKPYSVIDWKLLEEHKEGLICLSACGNGIISSLLASNPNEAIETLLKLKNIFGDDFGLEVQPNNMDRGANAYNDKIDQRFINRKLINLGKEHNVKVVAACNSHYITKDQSETHDVLLAIGGHQPIYSNFRLRYPVPDFYLKSGDEVKAFFSRNYGDVLAQELCDNSIYFADKCEVAEWIDPKFSNPSGKELPIFPIKDENDYEEYLSWITNQSSEVKSLNDDKSYLRFKCFKNWDAKLPHVSQEMKKEYLDRLEEELDVLQYLDFCSYMLIVADYVNWSKQNNISVGPGRGSVGGSLVGYLIGIHAADPIKYGLVFARFHNKDKKSYPDVDLDFATSGREKVINYIKQKYGYDYVASVSNINTITPKVYIKDIARACELGGSKEAATIIGNSVADCIPASETSIDACLTKYPLFAEYCKKYPQFIKYKQICGQYRAFGTHAGGIVISARSLVGLIPVRKDKDGSLALEYDKVYAEENGLVKMDILGLSTLDIVSDTLELIKKANKPLPNIDFNQEDEKTYDLIRSGNTFKVFQFGTSAGTMDLCKKMKPSNIEDLASINAIARPATKEIRNDYALTKDGKKKVILLHPKMERAFNPTYGFGIYEESLIYLVQDLAGWTLNDADRLRKMTKDKGKYPEKTKKIKDDFIKDCISNKIQESLALRIWDEIILPYSNYGFNKAHALLYSILGYETAYLKAHYTIEFLMANLAQETQANSLNSKPNIDKIKKEIRENKFKILPPNINLSEMTYTLDGQNILTGLEALKSVGIPAIEDVLEKRPFKDFFDFMHRVSSSKVRANTIQAFAASGALDSFKLTRKQIFYYCADYRKKLQIWLKKHDPNTEEFIYPFPKEEDFTIPEKYALEFHYMNEGFVCQPFKAYKNFFSDNHDTVKDIKKSENKKYLNSVKCIVRDYFEFKIKKEASKMYGQTMAKILIEDKFGNQCSCTIFPDRLQLLQSHMKTFNKGLKFEPGVAMNFSGSANVYEDEMGIIFDKVYSVVPSPQTPKDMKAKKIVSKKSKKSENADIDSSDIKDIKPLNDNEDLFEQLEDGLYEDGLLDFEEDF